MDDHPVIIFVYTCLNLSNMWLLISYTSSLNSERLSCLRIQRLLWDLYFWPVPCFDTIRDTTYKEVLQTCFFCRRFLGFVLLSSLGVFKLCCCFLAYLLSFCCCLCEDLFSFCYCCLKMFLVFVDVFTFFFKNENRKTKRNDCFSCFRFSNFSVFSKLINFFINKTPIILFVYPCLDPKIPSFQKNQTNLKDMDLFFEISRNHPSLFSEKDDRSEKKDDHPIILFVYPCLVCRVFVGTFFFENYGFLFLLGIAMGFVGFCLGFFWFCWKLGIFVYLGIVWDLLGLFENSCFLGVLVLFGDVGEFCLGLFGILFSGEGLPRSPRTPHLRFWGLCPQNRLKKNTREFMLICWEGKKLKSKKKTVFFQEQETMNFTPTKRRKNPSQPSKRKKK